MEKTAAQEIFQVAARFANIATTSIKKPINNTASKI